MAKILYMELFSKMKSSAFVLLFFLSVAGCIASRQAQPDIYFLPCAAKASVSFPGGNQVGDVVNRLEVRRLAYASPDMKKRQVANGSCVLYYAGDDKGLFILCVLDDCIDPLVKKVSNDIVEIYFLAGAHTHIRQRWRLMGYTAALEKSEEISWRDGPTDFGSDRT